MLVHESRILQVTLFGTLQSNLSLLDFSLLLPDVMTIADEVDAQLTQSMDSYMKIMQTVSGSVTATNQHWQSINIPATAQSRPTTGCSDRIGQHISCS